MKPWLLASTKCDCWQETLAPSELTMRASSRNAAASQRRVPQSQNERQTGEYALVNAQVSYRFTSGAARGLAYVKLSNLANATARMATSQLREIAPLGGRALSAGVRFDF